MGAADSAGLGAQANSSPVTRSSIQARLAPDEGRVSVEGLRRSGRGAAAPRDLQAAQDLFGARAAIGEAKAQWTHGKFLLQDWQIMRSEAEIELYVSDGPTAYDRLKRDEGPLDKSLLLNVQLLRIFTAYAVGRAAIASIDPAGSPRSDRVAEANQRAVALRGEQMPWADVYAATLTACGRRAEGDREGALVALREAIALSDAADMMLHAAAARHQLGLVLGGAEGALELQQAEETMRAQDLRVPGTRQRV